MYLKQITWLVSSNKNANYIDSDNDDNSNGVDSN